jgi:hypothetical protein
MKTLLVVAFVLIGPNDKPDLSLHRYSLATEEACMEAATRWPRFDLAPHSGGQIANVPGYRIVEGAWCEDPDGAWPSHQAPVMGIAP